MGKVLGREQITATPQTRTVGAGGVISYTPTTPIVTFWASVQPIGKHEIQLLPEGSRSSARWILYPEGVPAFVTASRYRLATSKGSMMVIGYVDLSVHTSGLPHIAPVCAEVGADE